MTGQRYGNVSRSYRNPANPQTAPQIAARAQTKLIALAYEDLSIAEATAWNSFADTLPREPGRLGRLIKLSGINAYQRYNMFRWSWGEAISDTPPVGITQFLQFSDFLVPSIDYNVAGPILNVNSTMNVVPTAVGEYVSCRITKPLNSEAVRPSWRDTRMLVADATTKVAYDDATLVIAIDLTSENFLVRDRSR